MSRKREVSPKLRRPRASSARVFTGPYRFAATQGCPPWLRSPKPLVCDSPSKQLEVFASVSNRFDLSSVVPYLNEEETRQRRNRLVRVPSSLGVIRALRRRLCELRWLGPRERCRTAAELWP